MPRIDPKLVERLRSKLGVGRSQLYNLIDRTSREMHIPRHFAAVALAASRSMNVSKWATDDYYAAIRGATHHPTGQAPVPASTAPVPARAERERQARAKAPTRAPGKQVFVVHGRDEPLRRSIFDFLRAVGLDPIEWSRARAMTKKPNPVISEILEVAFSKASAVVVVMSPDDEAKLSDRLIRPGEPAHERRLMGQPRPNVLWEGGIAWAHDPNRTVIVEVGNVRKFSDISGHHILRLTDAPEDRSEFVARLRSARCPVDDKDKTDWLSVGRFQITPGKAKRTPKRKKSKRKRTKRQ